MHATEDWARLQGRGPHTGGYSDRDCPPSSGVAPWQIRRSLGTGRAPLDPESTQATGRVWTSGLGVTGSGRAPCTFRPARGPRDHDGAATGTGSHGPLPYVYTARTGGLRVSTCELNLNKVGRATDRTKAHPGGYVFFKRRPRVREPY